MKKFSDYVMESGKRERVVNEAKNVTQVAAKEFMKELDKFQKANKKIVDEMWNKFQKQSGEINANDFMKLSRTHGEIFHKSSELWNMLDSIVRAKRFDNDIL